MLFQNVEVCLEAANNVEPDITGIHWTNMTGSNIQFNLTTDIQNEIKELLTCILRYLKRNFGTKVLKYEPASEAERTLICKKTSILRKFGFIHTACGMYRYELGINTIGGNDSNIKSTRRRQKVIFSSDSDSGTTTTTSNNNSNNNVNKNNGHDIYNCIGVDVAEGDGTGDADKNSGTNDGWESNIVNMPLDEVRQKSLLSISAEQEQVRVWYGSKFKLCNVEWDERTLLRLCTGCWYNDAIMMGVIRCDEREPNASLPKRCYTREGLNRWSLERPISKSMRKDIQNCVAYNYLVNHSNVHWGFLISTRKDRDVDILYVDSLNHAEKYLTQHFKSWWEQAGKQFFDNQLVVRTHEITVPTQIDTVQCGVFTICYHNVIFNLTHDPQWLAATSGERLVQLRQKLVQVTPEVAAVKRLTIRETYHHYGQRSDVIEDDGSHSSDLYFQKIASPILKRDLLKIVTDIYGLNIMFEMKEYITLEEKNLKRKQPNANHMEQVSIIL